MHANKQASKQTSKQRNKETNNQTNKQNKTKRNRTKQNRTEQKNKQTNNKPIDQTINRLSHWLSDWLIASLPDWLTDALISIFYPCLLVWQWPFQRNSIISSRQLASKYHEGFYVYCVCVCHGYCRGDSRLEGANSNRPGGSATTKSWRFRFLVWVHHSTTQRAPALQRRDQICSQPRYDA